MSKNQVKFTAWLKGLEVAKKDKSLHILSSNDAVVIKDKYPKAKYHFLIIPYENINTLYDLRKDHIPLLEELQLLAKNVTEVLNLDYSNFKIGFHSIPSMSALHLHVISKDFCSPSLKTKRHWNSFNTKFFLEANDLIKIIQEKGFYTKDESMNNLLNTQLECNQCDFNPKNMPDLKKHLETHIK